MIKQFALSIKIISFLIIILLATTVTQVTSAETINVTENGDLSTGTGGDGNLTIGGPGDGGSGGLIIAPTPTDSPPTTPTPTPTVPPIVYQASSWTPLGPEGQSVKATAISPNFANDGILFAVTTNGLFKIATGSSQWEQLSNGLPAFSPDAFYSASIVISPRNIAGNNTGSNQSSGSPDATPTSEISPEPTPTFPIIIGIGGNSDNSSEVINSIIPKLLLFVNVPGSNAVYRSIDSGSSWELVNEELINTQDSYSAQIAVAPNYEQSSAGYSERAVLISTGKGSMAKSIDGGNSWQTIQPFPEDMNWYVQDFAYSPNYDQDTTIFAVINYLDGTDAVLKSTDRGETWNLITLPPNYVLSIGVSPDYLHDQTVFAGASTQEDQVLKSTDGGSTWISSSTGITGGDIREFAISPDFAHDGTIYAASGRDEIYISTDKGSTWQLTSVIDIPGGSTENFCGSGSVVISPGYTGDHTVFAGCDDASLGGVWKHVLSGGTPAGTDVIVPLGTNTSVKYSSISESGLTSVTTSTQPPAEQQGFNINNLYFDITTSASFAGPVIVTFPYDPATVTDPEDLHLYHFDSLLNSWVDVTTNIDTVNYTVSGEVYSFSWFAVAPRQITSLKPAKIWVGLRNSDDVGVKFDLKAEVYKDNELISTGSLNTVTAGSSGFNNAKLNTIPFGSFAPVVFPAGSQLQLKLYVRNACSGSGHNSGTARLWFNDNTANSQFGAAVGYETGYFLRDAFALSSTPGTGPKKTIDVQAGTKCSSYKPFGAWMVDD